MNKTCLIALKLTDEIPCGINGDFIGADKGALVLAEKGIRMKLAIGDFDSVEESDLAKIQEWSDEVIRLNPIKNDSDSEAAIRKAIALGYEHIVVLGALGGRIDHELVNLRLAYDFPDIVELWDPCNKVEALSQGSWKIYKKNWHYVSFFAGQDTEISLKGFFYPLDHRTLTFNDLYALSNEITSDPAEVIVHHGKVLMICSRDGR